MDPQMKAAFILIAIRVFLWMMRIAVIGLIIFGIAKLFGVV